MAECAVKRVGGVRNMELRIFLVDKKVREICFQTSIRRPDAPMGVKPSAILGVRRALFQKPFPRFMPGIKFFGAGRFCCFGKRESERSQFFTCLQFWSSGQIAVHSDDLVELAELYRDIRENLFYAPFSVDDHCINGIAERFDELPPFAIRLRGLGRNFCAVEILLEFRRTEHDDAVAPAPECYVRDDHDRLTHELHAAIRSFIQLFTNP